MNICGIDPSINSTALTVLNDTHDNKMIDFLIFGSIKKYDIYENYKYLNFKDGNNYVNFFMKNNFVIDNILNFLRKHNVEYIAIENYSYCSLTKTAYQIGEFIGCLKRELFNNNYKIRLYEPSVIKMFFTGKGNALKSQISDIIENYYEHEINTIVKELGDYKYDIYDSFSIAMLLKKELYLKQNKNKLVLNKVEENIFMKTHKKDKETLLDKDFIFNKIEDKN